MAFASAEERAEFLASVAQVHDEWVARMVLVAPFVPLGRAEDSDYNLHYADVESLPDQESEIQRAWEMAGLTVVGTSTEEELAARAEEIKAG